MRVDQARLPDGNPDGKKHQDRWRGRESKVDLVKFDSASREQRPRSDTGFWPGF